MGEACAFLHKARRFTGLNIRALFVLQGLTVGSFLSDFVEYSSEKFLRNKANGSCIATFCRKSENT